MAGFEFDRNNIMFAAFNRKFLQLIESGIAAKFLENYNYDDNYSFDPITCSIHAGAVGCQVRNLPDISCCFLFMLHY